MLDRATRAPKHLFEKIVSTIFSTLLGINFSDVKYFQTYSSNVSSIFIIRYHLLIFTKKKKERNVILLIMYIFFTRDDIIHYH